MTVILLKNKCKQEEDAHFDASSFFMLTWEILLSLHKPGTPNKFHALPYKRSSNKGKQERGYGKSDS